MKTVTISYDQAIKRIHALENEVKRLKELDKAHIKASCRVIEKLRKLLVDMLR